MSELYILFFVDACMTLESKLEHTEKKVVTLTMKTIISFQLHIFLFEFQKFKYH